MAGSISSRQVRVSFRLMAMQSRVSRAEPVPQSLAPACPPRRQDARSEPASSERQAGWLQSVPVRNGEHARLRAWSGRWARRRGWGSVAPRSNERRKRSLAPGRGSDQYTFHSGTSRLGAPMVAKTTGSIPRVRHTLGMVFVSRSPWRSHVDHHDRYLAGFVRGKR